VGHERVSGPEGQETGIGVLRTDKSALSRDSDSRDSDHHVLQLQRSVGNAAVASALSVQRGKFGLKGRTSNDKTVDVTLDAPDFAIAAEPVKPRGGGGQYIYGAAKMTGKLTEHG
jgi:hypothetical protein